MRKNIIIMLGVALVAIALMVPFASAASLMSRVATTDNQIGTQDGIQDMIRDHLRAHNGTSSQDRTMIQDRTMMHDRLASQDMLMNQNSTTICCQNLNETQYKLMDQERAGR